MSVKRVKEDFVTVAGREHQNNEADTKKIQINKCTLLFLAELSRKCTMCYYLSIWNLEMKICRPK